MGSGSVYNSISLPCPDVAGRRPTPSVPFSMPSSTFCAPAARGATYHVIFHPGKRCSTTFDACVSNHRWVKGKGETSNAFSVLASTPSADRFFLFYLTDISLSASGMWLFWSLGHKARRAVPLERAFLNGPEKSSSIFTHFTRQSYRSALQNTL